MSKKRLPGATQPERREWALRIKTLRQEAGLKQEELAEQAGVSRVTVSNIERGTTVPQIDVLRRLLEVLGVETEEVEFERQTELWLTMLGTLIEAIPDEQRVSMFESVFYGSDSGLARSSKGRHAVPHDG